MRPVQITQLSESEVLIHDDAAFLMHLRPDRVETAGQDFVGLEHPDQWWLKLVMEYSRLGHCLWFRQEPRSTNGRPTSGSLINPIGRLTELNDAVKARLELANQLLARPVQYAVAWLAEGQAYYGAANPDTGWIQPPNCVIFSLRRGINNHEDWQQLLHDARTLARRFDLPFVHNLDLDPD